MNLILIIIKNNNQKRIDDESIQKERSFIGTGNAEW